MAYINYPFLEIVYENLKKLSKKLITTTAHIWCNGNSTSISACRM